MADLLFVGSYGSGLGVYSRVGARLTHLHTVDAPDPSFVIKDPARPVIYAVNELADGAVSSFALRSDGSLRLLATQPTGGAEPCHLALHRDHLITANYRSGSTSVHPIAPDGTLGPRTDLVAHPGPPGPDPQRQDGAHAHQVVIDGDRVTVVDLGSDRLWHHRLDTVTGRLAASGSTPVPSGAGPRHAVVHPSGRWHIAHELDSTVATYASDPAGLRLSHVQPATTATREIHNLPSGIVLSQDGRFLYVANRGADSITTFAIGEDGSLTTAGEIAGGGRWPRDLALVDDLLFVANQHSHSVVPFRIDPASGLPHPTGEAIETNNPSCVLP